MFTGIITGLGRIEKVENLGENPLAVSSTETAQDSASTAHAAAQPIAQPYGKRLYISTPAGYLDGVNLGDSIALNGACMTATSLDTAKNQFSVDISAESLAKTSGLDLADTQINLEKALRVGDPLGGHIVSGHVDGVAIVSRFEAVGESWHLAVDCPKALAPYLAAKGSITLNGVSLTINQVDDSDQHASVHVNLIPHTVSHTSLGQLQSGSPVNVEIDTIARYVQRMLSTTQQGS